MDNQYEYSYDDDYAQSANTLFHFMKKPEYLYDILARRAIVPRYCVENIDYLNIHGGSSAFQKVAVLQKCFCDIPFHKLAENFVLNGTGKAYESLSSTDKVSLQKNNTHFDYYGSYAIAFSKKWGECNDLQPIHYLNTSSSYASNFSNIINQAINTDDIIDEYVYDILSRLAFVKPLRGIMQRRFSWENNTDIDLDIYKNFHDECEWRYVPEKSKLDALKIHNIIANPNLIPMTMEINRRLEDPEFCSIWLGFNYYDIKYIIVPNSKSRIDLINRIIAYPDDYFEEDKNVDMQKYIMISKIMVLDDIRKDW